jgi:predicted MFS family arabinose efflux permease
MSLPLLGWQGVFQLLGAACIAVAVFMFTMVPDRSTHAGPHEQGSAQGFATVFKSPLFLRVIPLTVVSQATFLSVTSLWAGTWLQDVAGLDRAGAANVLAAMTGAMIAGFVVLGSVASSLGSKGVSPFTTATSCVVTASVPIIVLVVMQSHAPPLACWVAFGFFGSGSILYYAALTQRFPKRISGRVNAAINVLVFLGAFLFQWGIGVIIQYWSSGDTFSTEGYRVALSGLLVLEALTLLWFLFFKREGSLHHQGGV